MDPIKVEKLQALYKYKRAQFIYKIIRFFIISFTVSHILPSPVCVVTLFSSIKFFFLVLLPKMGTFLIGPKCLFILFNVIVIFLVGEFKFGSSSSPKPDIYEEYVERTRSNLRLAKEREKIAEKLVIREKLRVKEEIKKKEEEEIEVEEEEAKKKVSEDFETEEEAGLPADVLNKRVEDFIARFNKQQRSEAQLMVCSG